MAYPPGVLVQSVYASQKEECSGEDTYNLHCCYCVLECDTIRNRASYASKETSLLNLLAVKFEFHTFEYDPKQEVCYG